MANSSTISWKDRVVLVTGVNGYVGQVLTRELQERQAYVVGLDLMASGSIKGGTAPAELVLVNLCDQEGMRELLQTHTFETCFHLAGQPGVAASTQDPIGALRANCQATWSLLEAFRLYSPSSEIIAVSSNHVYGPQEKAPTAEDQPFNGLSIYAVSKACADVIARSYAENYGLSIAIARITNSFGGCDPHRSHIVTGTIVSALQGEAPVIQGDGRSEKGYLYIRDTVGALLHLAERIGSMDLAGEAFNFVPDKPVSVEELVDTILRLSGQSELRPVVLGHQNHPAEFESLSNAKAARVLGWRPDYSLEQGLSEAIQDLQQILTVSAVDEQDGE